MPSPRHTRTCSTAVRFRFGGQSAWLGFNRVSRGSTGSGLGSTPGVPSLSIVMPGLVPGISAGAIAEAEVDARNKSGHDGRACRKGRSSMMERDRTEGPWAPVRLRPTAEPDSSGLVPGIHAAVRRKRWREIPGTSPGMTKGVLREPGRRLGYAGQRHHAGMCESGSACGRGRKRSGPHAPDGYRICAMRMQNMTSHDISQELLPALMTKHDIS